MAKTLLLADDSVTIQRVVELSFAHEDVRIVSVSDGERAMQWLESDSPDVVLLDVAVPEVDGYAIAKHIKKTARLKQVPVLLMSGAFESVDEEKAKAIGCDGIIVKPFEPKHLVERVRELLDRGAADGQAAGGEAAPEPAAVASAQAAGPKPVAAAHKPRTGPASVPEPKTPVAVPDFDEDDEGLPPVGLPSEPVELGLPSVPVWAKEQEKQKTKAKEQAPAAPAPAEAAAGKKATVVSAFSALLAAEKAGRDGRTSSAGPVGPVSDDAVEAAVRRVLERMTGDQVRQIVLETAERLIREEIEKIKADSE